MWNHTVAFNMSLRNLSDVFVAIYLMINGAEWFVLASKKELLPLLGNNAILMRLQDRGLMIRFNRISLSLTRKIGIRSAAALMFCSGLVLFGMAASSNTSALVSIVALLSIVGFNLGFSFGLEGSDQMATLVLFANAMTALMPKMQWLTDVFIMAQLILSYGVAGVAKLVSSDWRSGRALGMILSTRSMGVGATPMLIRNPRVSRLICSLIIGFELAWFALPLNKPLALGLMACGVMFHFSSAWIMGLNLFPWAFVSAYPLALSALYRIHG